MLRLMRIVGMLLGLMILLLVGMMGYLRRLPSEAAWIAFTAFDAPSSNDLYRMFPDGSNLRLLALSRGDYRPSWSPDGEWISFTTADGLQQQIYRIRPSGLELQQLSHGYNDSNPLYTADGEWIVFHSFGTGRLPDLVRMRPDGRDIELITPLEVDVRSSSLSPDGEWVAYYSDHYGMAELYKIRIDGTNFQSLNVDIRPRTPIEWSPTGEWVLYSSFASGELYRVRSDGTDLERLTQNNDDEGAFSFSPDGQWIVYVSNEAGDSDIYKMRADGTTVSRVTDFVGEELYPTVSPDGKWILFSGWMMAGSADLYRIRMDGTDLQRLTTLPSQEWKAQWSPRIDREWNGWQLGAVGIGLLVGVGGLSVWGRKKINLPHASR